MGLPLFCFIKIETIYGEGERIVFGVACVPAACRLQDGEVRAGGDGQDGQRVRRPLHP